MNSKRFESAVFSFSYVFIFVMMQIAVLIVSVAFSSAFRGASDLNDKDIYTVTAIADILSVFLLFIILRLRRQRIKDVTDLTAARFAPLAMAVIGGIAFSGATNILLSVFTSTPALQSYMETYAQQFSAMDLKNNLLIQGFCIWLLIPVCEEIVFRGFLFNELKNLVRPKYAIIIQAFLFGLIHMNLIQGIYTFIIALFFGYAYQKTGKILVPILMHVVFNIMGTSLGFINNDNAVLIITLAGIPLTIVSMVYFMKAGRKAEESI